MSRKNEWGPDRCNPNLTLPVGTKVKIHSQDLHPNCPTTGMYTGNRVVVSFGLLGKCDIVPASGGKMSDAKKQEIAKQIVDKQLETMKKYDAAPDDMSEQEYKQLVNEVADNVKT